MNSPCLVRHQCRDNGQRQAGESMGSEASCVASQRPSSQASGPGLRSQLLLPGPGRESCNCCRSQARHALQKALANWPLLGTRELERKPLDAHGPGKSSTSRKPGLPELRAEEGSRGDREPPLRSGKDASDTHKSPGKERAWVFIIPTAPTGQGYTEPQTSQQGSHPAQTVLHLDQVSDPQPPPPAAMALSPPLHQP